MATVPKQSESKSPPSRRNAQGWAPSGFWQLDDGAIWVYGGRYVPETLMAALEELEREYEKAKRDPNFRNGWRIAAKLMRPSDLPKPSRSGLTQKLGGAKIYFEAGRLVAHRGAQD